MFSKSNGMANSLRSCFGKFKAIIKAKPKAKRNNSLMSEGLVIEILVRLPVDSLLRFKCVCKSWYSLISSPFFIAKHLQLCNSTNKPDPDLMFYADDQRPGNNGVENIFIVSHETMEVSEIEEESSPHSIAESSGDESQDEDDDQAARSTVLMVGSCNGLICLYFKADGAIWNPATNETKFIPRFSGRGGHFKASGFGYDARNNDYKLIVIHSSPSIGADHNYDHDTGCFQFEAYSLRADCWKFVTDFPKMGLTFSDQLIGTHANGICSWLAHREDSIRGVRRDEIISFDIINEEIIRTPLPSEIAEIGTHLADKIGNIIVGVFNGSFAVVNVNQNLEDIPFFFHIWVLREVGVVESWTKLFTIGPLQGVISPLLLWKTGLVLLDEDSEELFFQNYNNQQKSSIGNFRDPCFMMHYRESLVPINDTKKERM
ncbi:F-box/kelch-repeat protein At3g23880-like [Ziziphus jujuba]|uniref:F-box/kelch-repeat protein At3g23880-like n=1 Tax=Ziziphus jujuba TaxID=326968 RepID=A0A6P3ZB34_ZIZJJ|nr:F-box/kelch-repeat protein At3g23880-like [Ziziphus jujuba]